jgi:adenomatous polyposis coli down-regulated (APCDD)-like protein
MDGARVGPAPATLVGKWTSATCEAVDPAAGRFLKRAFRFTSERWEVTGTVYGDAACRDHTLTFEIEGPYLVEGPSRAVLGATDAAFAYARKTMTAHTPAMAAQLDAAGCGDRAWTVNRPQDISRTGCLTQKPITEACRQEYDVFSIEGNTLWFGRRNADMCTRRGRPTALSPFPLTRLQ